VAVSKEYKNYIEDCLLRVGDVRIRSMMGGFLVYYKGKLVGDIGDGMLLIRHTATSDRLLSNAEQAYPYEESRTLMWVMDHPEDTELLRELFAGMYDDLPAKSR